MDFDFAALMEKARRAVQMISLGREALSSVTDAVRDSGVALSTNQLSELNAILAQEQKETEAADNTLRRAIEEARSQNR